jgi:hypothetical protein
MQSDVSPDVEHHIARAYDAPHDLLFGRFPRSVRPGRLAQKKMRHAIAEIHVQVAVGNHDG